MPVLKVSSLLNERLQQDLGIASERVDQLNSTAAFFGWANAIANHLHPYNALALLYANASLTAAQKFDRWAVSYGLDKGKCSKYSKCEKCVWSGWADENVTIVF